MAKLRVSKLRLLAELRKMLARPDTTVKERRQKWCGQSTWEIEPSLPPKNITILLDPRRDGRVRLVIHELLHVWFAHHLGLEGRLTYELEEAAVLAWEQTLYKWLHDPKRADELESWNQAIARKTRKKGT